MEGIVFWFIIKMEIKTTKEILYREGETFNEILTIPENLDKKWVALEDHQKYKEDVKKLIEKKLSFTPKETYGYTKLEDLLKELEAA